MKWHEKARYPFQLPPQILFEGTTYSDIKRCPVYEIMRAQKKLIRDGAHYRFFFSFDDPSWHQSFLRF